MTIPLCLKRAELVFKCVKGTVLKHLIASVTSTKISHYMFVFIVFCFTLIILLWEPCPDTYRMLLFRSTIRYITENQTANRKQQWRRMICIYFLHCGSRPCKGDNFYSRAGQGQRENDGALHLRWANHYSNKINQCYPVWLWLSFLPVYPQKWPVPQPMLLTQHWQVMETNDNEFTPLITEHDDRKIL